MEIKTISLLKLLNKSQVLYSTDFTAEYKAPADLLELLLENSQTGQPLFNGFIFLQKKEDGAYIVVDGIKRLISFSLLLHAICECYKLSNKKNIIAIEKIKKRYLFNGEQTKIQLNGKDKNIYEKLVKYERMTDEEKDHPFFINLHEFWAKINMYKLSPVKLFNQIKNIKVFLCEYENCTVENRDIYQMLNCNNPQLQEITLITDFIKQNIGEKVSLWKDIVDLFIKEDMTLKFRYFLCDFLTIQKNGIVPRINEIYQSFKCYYINLTKAGMTPERLFADLKRSAMYYIKISKADFENKTIKEQITTIKENNMYETFPYLLEVVDDYLNERITEYTLISLLNTVILFVAEQRSNGFASSINFGNLSQEINMRIQ